MLLIPSYNSEGSGWGVGPGGTGSYELSSMYPYI